jgi:hypothetical protein
MPERFAVYLTLAADSDLYKLGSKWLGRDHYQDHLDKLECDYSGLWDININQVITKKASLYGFHATLKPPFRLKQGYNCEQLKSILHRIAKVHQAYTSCPFAVGVIGKFLALQPTQNCAQLNQLADHCVQAFEPYRAELTDAEINRRQLEKLTMQQKTYLQQWGYPYVFEQFRCHFTLTDSLSDQQMMLCQPLLGKYFNPICIQQGLRVNQISLLHQPSLMAPFTVIETALLAI